MISSEVKVCIMKNMRFEHNVSLNKEFSREIFCSSRKATEYAIKNEILVILKFLFLEDLLDDKFDFFEYLSFPNHTRTFVMSDQLCLLDFSSKLGLLEVV